jgi:hypothetical protein
MTMIKSISSLLTTLLRPGLVQAEGVFRSAKPGAGVVGLAFWHWELFVELIPIRPNRTYYRLAMGRA